MYTVVVVVGGVGIVIAFALIENLDRLVRTSVFPRLASSFRPIVCVFFLVPDACSFSPEQPILPSEFT